MAQSGRMQTSISAFAGALGALAGVVTTLIITGRRERRWRSHTDRLNTARAYLAALDDYRRKLREQKNSTLTDASLAQETADSAGRTLADAAVLMSLFFDAEVD